MRLSDRFTTIFLALAIPAFAAAGCTSATNTAASTASTVTAPSQVTEAYSGTLNVNGAATFTFSAMASGPVTASLKSVSPASSATLGLALGIWNGVTCQVVIANDAATTSAVVTGAASSAGTLCVRVYDIGKLTATQTIEITVTHF